MPQPAPQKCPPRWHNSALGLHLTWYKMTEDYSHLHLSIHKFLAWVTFQSIDERHMSYKSITGLDATPLRPRQ